METDTSPAAIAKRLEALSKWHNECRTLLNNKHDEERASLGNRVTPTKMNVNANSNTMQAIDLLYPNENDEHLQKDISGVLVFEETPRKSSTGQLSKPTSGYVTSDSKVEETDSAQSIPKTSINETAKQSINKALAPPKRFLRKGEGIKQRFKIEPDAFNLKKLPPYKYAKTHAKLTTSLPKPRKPKAGKIHSPKVNDQALAPVSEPFTLDTQEILFQRLLFASSTVCNSTPDSKSIFNTPVETSSMEKTNTQQLSSNPQNSQEVSSLDMAWSKVLDPLNIRPIPVAQLRVQNETAHQRTLNETEDENLNLFELLEEKAKEGSFNFNCSLIKRILSKNIVTHAEKDKNEENSDKIPISKELHNAHIEPRIDPNDILSSSESEQGDVLESEGDDEDESSESDSGDDENEEETTMLDENANSASEKHNACLRVRFVDDRKENSEDQTLENQTIINSINNSSVDNSAIFEQMKALVMAALAKNENSGANFTSTFTPPLNAVEMKQLAEQGRQRVDELEKQIALFKETNTKLMKAKQEHELEKVHFLQQQEEALEQLNDERVKMEIELHDERMKLEQERRKGEEKLRMQKASLMSCERKEITKLKEEIASLQNKLRDKDQNHTAAQARLRSQLRVLEKEQKNLYDEIERLGKENKKLEKQTAQLQREQNSTMLSEINRNLVKIAGSNKIITNSDNMSKEKMNGKPSKLEQPEQKQPIVKRATSKRCDNSGETLKTLKITASSFTNLLPANILEKNDSKELEKEDDAGKEASKMNVSIVSRHAELVESLSYSPTNERGNMIEETMKSPPNFKNLTREITNADGGKEIIYPNGTIRKESGDGLLVRMMYFNGDVKETNVKEGTIKYYYSKTNTWHTTYLDGLEIIEFPNGQIEHRLPSGIIEVHYPHKNCVKIMDPKDPEKLAEYIYDDGTKVCEMRNGNKLLTMPNGQKELTTKEFKRREYPDGTVKTVYPDGSHETRYSNGRLRLKDKDGNLIMDTEMPAINQKQQQQQTVIGFN